MPNGTAHRHCAAAFWRVWLGGCLCAPTLVQHDAVQISKQCQMRHKQEGSTRWRCLLQSIVVKLQPVEVKILPSRAEMKQKAAQWVEKVLAPAINSQVQMPVLHCMCAAWELCTHPTMIV